VLIQLREWEAAERKLREVMQRSDNDPQDPLYDMAYKKLIGKVLPNIKPR